MRNRVFWNSPQTKIAFSVMALGLTMAALVGCGGGGGNGGGNNGNNNNGNVSITGIVKDTGGAVVPNALVSISGTSLSTHTDASGHYSFVSVPNTVTAFTVSNPNVNKYFSYANYNGDFYDIINCPFQITGLHSGTNTLPEVDIYVGGNSPPPAPPNGCPGANSGS